MRRTNPQELKCWSTLCVNYFLRYYLMMQHQLIVKRVDGTHEWAHRPISYLSLLLVQTQAAGWKAATPEQLTGAHLYLDIAMSGYLFHAVGNVMGHVWHIYVWCQILDATSYQRMNVIYKTNIARMDWISLMAKHVTMGIIRETNVKIIAIELFDHHLKP